jgi:hypothetical protein
MVGDIVWAVLMLVGCWGAYKMGHQCGEIDEMLRWSKALDKDGR